MIGTSKGDDSNVSSKPSQLTSTIVPTAIDHSSLQITTHKLNGKNFLQWLRATQMVICGRRKIGYVHDTIKKPKETDPTFHIWDANNSIIIAWLVNSMEENIGENYMYYSTAKELWDTVNRAFSDLENLAQMFELRDKVRNLRQGDMDVIQYFNIFNKLWQEIGMFNDCVWSFAKDSERYKKIVDKEQIFDFIA